MRDFFIDRQGRSWTAWGLATWLGVRAGDDELRAFAVKERGFIHLSHRSDGLKLTVRAKRFTQKAFLGAMLSLEKPPARILVSVFDGAEWTHQLFTSLLSCGEYLEDIAADRPVARREPWMATPLDFGVLQRPQFAAFRLVTKVWAAACGRMPEDFDDYVLACGLEPRAIVVRRPYGTKKLVHERVPTATSLMRPCDWLNMIGREVEELPDQRYGAWAARIYHELLASGRPKLDNIRATTRTLSGSVLRISYQRLALPWSGPSGEAFVSAFTVRRELSIAPAATARSMSAITLARS